MRLDSPRSIAVLHYASIVTLIALIALCLAWETRLAPLRPGGSWLVLKTLPLLLPLFGILHGKRYTYQWTSLLVWFYFTEGAVRAWSDAGFSARLALVEVALSIGLFLSTALYAKATRTSA